MKKEIKFRVWDSEKNQFFNLRNAMVIGLNGEIILMTNQGPYPYPIAGGIERFIIQQYTGIKSQCGEVYEGDIIRNQSGRVFIVEWLRSGYVFREVISNTPQNCPVISVGDESLCQIIGNIFENKDIINRQ